MRSECAFIIVDFAFCFSLESSRIDWTCAVCDGFPVHRGPLGRRLVRIVTWKAVLSAEVDQVRAESVLSIAAPRQRALYPILPFSTLP